MPPPPPPPPQPPPPPPMWAAIAAEPTHSAEIAVTVLSVLRNICLSPPVKLHVIAFAVPTLHRRKVPGWAHHKLPGMRRAVTYGRRGPRQADLHRNCCNCSLRSSQPSKAPQP